MRKPFIFMLTACLLLCALTACGGTQRGAALPGSPGDEAPSQAQGQMQAEPLEAPESFVPQNIPSEEPSVPEPVAAEEPSVPQTGWPAVLIAYTDILEELYQAYQDPERFRYEDGPSFALYDVDLDGTEELIVQDPSGEVAGQWVRIYGYDTATGTAYVELEEYPNLYYYDNGTIEAGWSHNQGAAGDKNLREVLAGEAFPDDVDQDGDGFVYYVITEEGGYAPVYGEAMDCAAYEAWRNSYLNGAFPSGPSFLPLVRENIEALGQ